MGKGSGRRPQIADDKEVQLRWDYAFRKEFLDSTFEEWNRLRQRKSSTRRSKGDGSGNHSSEV